MASFVRGPAAEGGVRAMIPDGGTSGRDRITRPVRRSMMKRFPFALALFVVCAGGASASWWQFRAERSTASASPGGRSFWTTRERAPKDEAGIIDFKGISDSVFDDGPSDDDAGMYQFDFSSQGDSKLKMDFQVAKELFEKEFIIHALKSNKGRINQTALKANIPKKTLLRKIEKYEINPKQYY